MSTDKLLVSVIVPVYQVESQLAQCVESLINQTYSPLEIILVDDGSTDQSPALCDLYAAQHINVRVVHKNNEGAAFARKTGLDIASGKYVLFLDGDDWLDNDTISACVHIALRDNADCVLFGYVREYSGKSIATPLFDSSFSYNQNQSEQLIHRRIIGLVGSELSEPQRIDNLSSFCMRLMRIEVARKGCFVSDHEIGTSEDTIFNIYALDGCQISYLHRCFYHYRKANASSITARYKPNLAEQWDTMYTIIQNYIKQSGKADAYQTPFLNRVACGMIGLGLNEISSPENIWKKAARLRTILKKPLYQTAFSQLDTTYCRFKWKIFFWLCKRKFSLLLAVLLQLINHLRSHVTN